MLLAPLWVSGVLLYRWEWPKRIPMGTAWGLLVASIVGIVAFHHTGAQDTATSWLKGWMGSALHEEFTFSKFFLSDYLLTLLVFFNFVAMRRVAEATEVVWAMLEGPIRFMAGFTFTLYLLHQPLFLFWGAVIQGDSRGPAYWLWVTAFTAASVLAIGHFTESRRHDLRRWLLARLERWRTLKTALPRAHDAG